MKSCLFIFLSILSIGFSEKVAKNRPNFGNTCSRGCFCESVYSVRCQNGGLDDVPNDLSPALTRLDLQRNRLFQVSSIINSYGKLQFLRLNQNNIGSLNSKNFDRLNELVDLEIADNKLSGLPDETFAGKYRMSQQVLDRKFLNITKGKKKNSRKFVYIPDKQCKSHVNLTNFF